MLLITPIKSLFGCLLVTLDEGVLVSIVLKKLTLPVVVEEQLFLGLYIPVGIKADLVSSLAQDVL